MNFRTTLILLLLLVVVGLGVFWMYRQKEATGDQDQTAGQTDNRDKPLFKDISATSVTAIGLEVGGKSAQLTRHDTQWLQTQPVIYPLDHYQAGDLAAQAVNLRYTESFEPGSKKAPALDQIGLAPALARLILTFDDAKKPARTLEIGKQILGGSGYVKLDNDPHVYIVPDSLHQMLLGRKDLDDVLANLRDHNLPVPNVGSVDQLILAREGAPIELTKTGSDWSLAAPYLGRAGADAVSGMVQALRTIRIEKYAVDQPADLALYGLDKPTAVVTVRAPELTAGAATQPASYHTLTVRLGATTPTENAYFATWTSSDLPTGSGNVVVQIPKDAAAALLKTVDQLRDPRITVVDSSDMKQLQVTGQGQTYTLVRSATGAWSFGPPDPGFKADAEQAGMLADAIANTRAKAYLPDFKPAGEPPITILITSMSRSQPDTLKIYAPAPATQPSALLNPIEPFYTVVRNDEPVGYQVPGERMARLREPVGALRDRVVLDVDPATVTRLAIRQPGSSSDAVPFVFQRDPLPPAPSAATRPTQPSIVPATQPVQLGAWKLVGQESFETDAFNALLKRLHPLKATRWLPETAAAATSEQAGLTIDVTSLDGKTVSLWLDARDPSANPAARVASLPPFTVDRADLDAASGEFRNRTLLPVATKDIRKVTIADRGRSLTVERDDAGTYSITDGQKANEASAGRIFDTLAGLRVKRYLPAISQAIPLRHMHVELSDGRSYDLDLIPSSGSMGQPTLQLQVSENSSKPTLLPHQRCSEVDAVTLKNLQLDPTGKDVPEISPADMGK